jgi:ribosomal-protein-alanine N-acetyltransferase
VTADPAVTFERLDPPGEADRAAILALEAAAFSNPWSAEGLAAMLSSPASRLHVARAPDRGIVAFCACWLVVDELHIHTIAVRAERRRQGVASALLRHVLDETGAIRATLEVRRSNIAAVRLYQRMGFKVTAFRERYYENPQEDALILWLNPSD